MRRGLFVGLASLVLAVAALPAVRAIPFGLLLVDVGLVWGVVAALRASRATEGGHAVVAALVAALAGAVILRFLGSQRDWPWPEGLQATLALPALLVAATATAVAPRQGAGRRPPRRAGAVAVGLALADVVLLLALASSADAPPSGSWRTFLATLGAVTALLGLQSLARLAQAPRVQALGSPAALAVAATQLLDGVVSYLAVRNPFGWLEEPHREQVRVSAILLEQTGPGFVLAKWGLALAVAFMACEPRGKPADQVHRAMLFLAVAYVGAGPGVYSTANLFL